MEQTEVNSVFKVRDQATGPLRQLTRGTDALHAGAERAQKATAAIGKTMPTAHGHEGATGAERERFKADREEMKARRSRTRGLRLEEQRENIYERAIELSSGAIVTHQNAYVARVSKLLTGAESLGYSMAGFSGKMGAFGSKLVQVAGKAVALGAAFEVGMAIGEKLNEAFHLEDKILRALGRQTDEDIKRGNEEYAKSLGYATVEQYAAATQVAGRMATDRELKARTQAAAAKLGAMPIDKTSVAMANWENQLLASARALAKPGEDFAEVVQRLREAAENTVPTLLVASNHQAKFNRTIEQASRGVQALPLHATLEEQQKYNEALAGAVQQLVAQGQLMQSEAGTAMERLRAYKEEHGSVGNTIEQFRENEMLQSRMNSEIKKRIRHLQVAPPDAAPGRFYKMNEDMARAASRAAEALSLTPEQTQEFLGKFKDAAMEKQKRVFDFRGSRFDIKQAFAEGFDPDRIAVAFSNDLASLGEQRIQSGMVPIPGFVR